MRLRSLDRPIHNLATHDSEFVTVKVLADYLECDERKVIRMLDAGSFDYVRTGREYRIFTSSIRQRLTVPHTTTTSNHQAP